jgi:hypothetical protein
MPVIKTLKKYEEEINILVPVDSIAQKLLSTFKEDEPHAVLLVQTIIETSMMSGNISHVYNALNGFSPDVDFKVGEVLYSESTYYDGDKNLPIGVCTIKDIKVYSGEKLYVSYTKNYRGSIKEDTAWVNHRKVKLATPEQIEAAKTRYVVAEPSLSIGVKVLGKIEL